MPTHLSTLSKAACAVAALVATVVTFNVQAAPHAHVHGEIQLGVALDGPTVTVDIDTPLESLLGFEHTPRSPAEKTLAAHWATILKQGTGLLRFNAEAACSLQQVALDAAVLGLGLDAGKMPSHTGNTGNTRHADLEGNWVFQCAHPEALRQLDIGFLKESPHAQKIEVKLITSKRQSKQRLMRPQTRIQLTQ